MPKDLINPQRNLVPTLADPQDAVEIAQLRTRLVDWMQQRGIKQWHHGEVSQARIQQQTVQREWWIIRADDGDLAATIRIIGQDTPIWGPPDRPAIFVHGLMINRHYAGHQLGRRLLGWAADHGRSLGAELLRLDCVATNTALCAYYLRLGFTRVATKKLPGNWATTALFERQVD